MTDELSNEAVSMELRKEAELRLKRTKTEGQQADGNAATQRLLHELEVHQIELEMQNAQLEESRDSMAAMLGKYMNLYDFAPVGYLSMTARGRVADVNLTGASLFELERVEMIERDFIDFVVGSSQADFTQFLERVFQENGKHIIELPLVTAAGAMRWVDAQAICLPSSSTSEPLCRLALSDITQLKRAEAAQTRLDQLVKINRELEEEIVQRRSAEKALKQSERRQGQLLKESQYMQDQLRQLSHGIINAQEEERRRISVELHDEITQTLVGVNIELGGLLNELFLNENYPSDKIIGIQKLVEKSISRIHRFAMELRPTILDDLGLEAAVKAYINNFEARSDIQVHFSPCADIGELDYAYRTVIFRVIQSAMANTLQHAHAKEVKINIDRLEDELTLDIHDDGQSFDVSAVMEANKHQRMGIVGMRERVECVGGQFEILSKPKSGTTIRVTLPIEQEEDALSEISH